MMTKGMELMIGSLIKMVGLDPAKVQSQIEDIRKALLTFANNSEIVRRQNSAIMAHFGIAEPLNGDEHGRQDTADGTKPVIDQHDADRAQRKA